MANPTHYHGPGVVRSGTRARGDRTNGTPRRPSPHWICQRCDRHSREILAAHRLNVIRIALRCIASDEVAKQELRQHLRSLSRRLRVPFLVLLECVDDDIMNRDLVELAASSVEDDDASIHCEAMPGAHCANPAAESETAIRSARARAGVEVVAAFVASVEDATSYDALSSSRALAEQLDLPLFVLDVLSGDAATSDINALVNWCAREQAAVQMVEEAVAGRD